ncbi:PAS domain-containing protein [Aquiflexum lacus]|uniref:PAS domain-containing protein n=1 Tax=Aquiflexum lacus TaxID=2483805 RepID=UPI001895D3DF|nr:PAS domain-containing protein [Aquiflexum lacus]
MTTIDSKYKAIFDVTPVAIWEQDFSEIKKSLVEKGLMGQPSSSVEKFLKNNSGFVKECISKLIIVDFNDACLKLHHAKSKKELKENFHKLFPPKAYELVIKQLAAICEEKNAFEDESQTITLDGQIKSISFKWKIVPGYEDSLKSVILTTEDITVKEKEIKRHEDLEQKLTIAQTITKVGYWELDIETGSLFWSDEVYNIWELNKSKTIHNFENFHQSIHPEDVNEFDWQNDQAITGNTYLDFKHRIITPNGEVKWVHEKGKLVDEKGKKIFKGTVQDITEEEILKQGLKDLLKRYHLVTKATFEAIYDWDVKSDTVVWGEGYRSIFGYKLEKFKPDLSTWRDNIHPDDLQEVLNSLEDYMESGFDNWQKEYRFRKANGEFVDVQDKSYALRDDKGKVYRMVGAIQDISEIKKANEELKTRNQFIQTTLDNIPIGIAVNEIDSGTATLLNRKFSEIYGWPPDEIENVENFFANVYPDPTYRQEIADRIIADIKSRNPERMSWNGIKITTKKGEERYISAKNIPLYDQNLMISTVLDETEKYEAEQELIKSNERFLYASKAVSDAIWDWDLKSGQIFWGPGYHELFGYATEMSIVDERFWKEAIHPEDFDSIHKSTQEARDNPQIEKWTGEYRFKKYNGEYAFVREKTLIIRNENGIPIRMVGALQDISAQKNYEESLYQERNLLRTLIDNIPDYIFVKDTQLRQIINNKANIQLLGAKNEEETIGKTTHQYFPKELADLYHQDDIFVMNSKKPIINKEEPIIDKNGQKKWLLTSKIPLFNPKGEALGLVGISRDITRSKEREQSLILKTKLLETIAEVVKLLLFNKNWESAMPECLELMGKAVAADRVYFFENYIDPISKKLYTRQLMEWVQNGISAQIKNPYYQAISLEEHPIFLELALQNEPFSYLTNELEGQTKALLEEQGIKSILQIPVFIKDHFYGYLGFDDCTQERKWSKEEISFLKTLSSNLAVAIERKNHLDSVKRLNEDLLQSNLELDISNKELEQFAYVASHDLQEPLRMITSFLGQLEKKYGDLLDEKAKQYIYYAVDGAKRMKSIISDLLEFSRIGRMADPISIVDLNKLMEEVKILLKSQIEENKATIVYPQLPVINSQKSQLRQVFQNIISNAIKYRQKGLNPIIELKIEEAKDQWHFIISDNGIGIATEYYQRIFVIFQRLHNKEEYSGTGIGLAICKKIVENIGGSIWVESEENKGSQFHIIVPKKPQT